MFKFFRKKEQPIEEKVEEQSIQFRSEEALMDNPSFSLLLQLNQKTGEYIIAVDSNDNTLDSAEMAATFITNLVHGELNPIIIEALSNYPEGEDEEEFIEATLAFWKEYEVQILNALQAQVEELEKEKKRKIDPTKIFNIRGGKQ
jgi:hypothetical protein